MSSDDVASGFYAGLKNQYVLLRHGQSEANVAGLIVSDPARGVDGFGLTDQGREQVRASVHAFREREDMQGRIATVRIHASDFKRARETAEVAARILGVEGAPVLEPGLRERFFGRFEGADAMNYETVWERDRSSPQDPGDGIEPVEDVRERARKVIASIEEQVEGALVLLVSHGDVTQILLADRTIGDVSRHREVPHVQTAELRPL